MIATAVLVILTILLITFVLRQRNSKRPPGPFPWPIIGHQYYLQHLTRKYGGQHLAFLALSKKYNSNVVSLQLGGSYAVAVSDSKLIQKVCHSDIYDGRPWNEFMKIRNLGMKKGITMNDGMEWKELRNWTVRALRNVGFAQEATMELLVEEIALISEKLASVNGGALRIRPVIAPVVMNVLWMLVTGYRPAENLEKLRHFMALMDRRAVLFDMTGGILSTIPWIRYIAPELSGYNTVVKLNNELKLFLMDTIKQHKDRYIKGGEADFIDLFIQEMYNSEGQEDKALVFSEDNLIVTLVDFFIAGTTTTTSTLDILFLNIANHQDVQRKLHEEIDAVVGPHRFPHLEDKKNLPYAEAVLTESQRIQNVGLILPPHRVLEDTTLDGYEIPKDTTVLMNLYVNNMDPEFYPDPTSFKPERYISKDGTFQTEKNLILFGKGKRRCIGEAMAKSAIFLLFVGIMQKFRLLPLPGKESIEVEYDIGITCEPKPYEMLIVPR